MSLVKYVRHISCITSKFITFNYIFNTIILRRYNLMCICYTLEASINTNVLTDILLNVTCCCWRLAAVVLEQQNWGTDEADVRCLTFPTPPESTDTNIKRSWRLLFVDADDDVMLSNCWWWCSWSCCWCLVAAVVNLGRRWRRYIWVWTKTTIKYIFYFWSSADHRWVTITDRLTIGRGV